MDVIARCAFGMTIGSLGEKDDPFMTKAKTIFNPPVNKTPLAVIPCELFFPYQIKIGFTISRVDFTHNVCFESCSYLSEVDSILGERVFLTEGFQFFIRLLENLIKERKEYEQVINIFHSSM